MTGRGRDRDLDQTDGAPPFAVLKTFIAGAVSGAIAKTSVAPFDRTKILMQVSHMYGWSRHRGSVWESMRTIWTTEGASGFFRGNSATVARIMPYAAIQFSAFEMYNRLLSKYVYRSDDRTLSKRFIAGAMAGVTSVAATYPIDLARTMLAVRVNGSVARRPGLFGTLFQVARTSGPGALYRGVYPTVVGVVPYAGTSFFVFGLLKRRADKTGVLNESRFLSNLACGGTAGLGKFIAGVSLSHFAFQCNG